MPRGLNLRILGDEQAATCTVAEQLEPVSRTSRRATHAIVSVFLTPFGSFSGTGSDVVPVTKLRAPSTSPAGRRAARASTTHVRATATTRFPDNDAGNIVGHFIKYIYGLNNGGGGTETCDFNSFGSCVAVLTE